MDVCESVYYKHGVLVEARKGPLSPLKLESPGAGVKASGSARNRALILWKSSKWP